MVILASIEAAVRRSISSKRLDEARAHVEELERSGASPARVTLHRAIITAAESRYHESEALSMLIQATESRLESPETYAMLYAEVGRLACRLNLAPVLRHVEEKADQLWRQHRRDPTLMRWRGRLLVSLALAAIHNHRAAEALNMLDEAVGYLQGLEDRPILVMAHGLRCHYLGQMGRLAEAEQALAEARWLDHDGSHAHRILLGKAWLALLRRDWAVAEATAIEAFEAAVSRTEPDWPAGAMALFARMDLAAAQGRADSWRLAEELRRVASEQHLPFLFPRIKETLLKNNPPGAPGSL